MYPGIAAIEDQIVGKKRVTTNVNITANRTIRNTIDVDGCIM